MTRDLSKLENPYGYRCPNVARFKYALCRVRVRTGGFLWWGGETTTYFLGAENEYTPLGATAFNGSLFLDPQTGDFGAVAVSDVELGAKEEEELNFAVRENGAVDLDYNLERWGYAAGTSRKRYAEMLPELRSRHFQQLLGAVAQAASATRELETDTEGYPFSLSFSAFVPGMAVVAGDAISLDVPQLAERLFALTGSARENPVGVEGEDTEKSTTFTIRFPEGYTEIEHIPESFRFDWYAVRAHSRVEDGAAVVEIKVTRRAHRAGRWPSDRAALFREWNRLAGSKANSTIVVRRR